MSREQRIRELKLNLNPCIQTLSTKKDEKNISRNKLL